MKQKYKNKYLGKIVSNEPPPLQNYLFCKFCKTIIVNLFVKLFNHCNTFIFIPCVLYIKLKI